MQSFDRCRHRVSLVLPLSQQLHSKMLISMTFLPRAYWSRGWYVRRNPCNKAHHWSPFCCDSFFSWILLKSFRHCFRANCRTEMADIEQAQQMIPFVTCEISFGQYVCELVLGVNVLDLNFWVQVHSIEWPIKRNSVGPGNMSHCGTPSLDDHLNHCFVVLKHIQQSFLMRKLDVWGNTINGVQYVGHPLRSLILDFDKRSPRSFRSLNRVSKDRNNQIQ